MMNLPNHVRTAMWTADLGREFGATLQVRHEALADPDEGSRIVKAELERWVRNTGVVLEEVIFTRKDDEISRTAEFSISGKVAKITWDQGHVLSRVSVDFTLSTEAFHDSITSLQRTFGPHKSLWRPMPPQMQDYAVNSLPYSASTHSPKTLNGSHRIEKMVLQALEQKSMYDEARKWLLRPGT